MPYLLLIQPSLITTVVLCAKLLFSLSIGNSHEPISRLFEMQKKHCFCSASILFLYSILPLWNSEKQSIRIKSEASLLSEILFFLFLAINASYLI